MSIRDTTKGHKERDIAIYRGVYALGVIVMPDNMVRTMRTSLDAMAGADYVMIPWSLAKSMHDTTELYILRKLPYLKELGARGKLIHFDETKGVLDLTEFGKLTMKKLTDKLHRRG